MRGRGWLLAGLGLLVGGWCARDIRLGQFYTLSPVMPTTAKSVLSARSADGLSFVVDTDTVIASGLASQAHHQTAEGHILVVGTDPTRLAGRNRKGSPPPERVSTLWTIDYDSGERKPLELAPCINEAGVRNAQPIQCVDPAIIVLPDGHTRMVFLRIAGRGDPAFTEEPNVFYSATLDADEQWRLDPGVRFTAVGAADPDLVTTHDGRVRMYFTKGNARGPQGKVVAPGIMSAVSEDGTTFVEEAGTRAHFCSASATIQLPGGGYRMYCHQRDIFAQGPDADTTAYIVSFRSDDGLSFTREGGKRIGPIPLPGERHIGAGAPSVSVDSDGEIRMLFTTVTEPKFPGNWAVLQDNARHFARVEKAGRQRVPHRGPKAPQPGRSPPTERTTPTR